MEQTNIVVDLETMGNGATSAIVALGAVKIDLTTGIIYDTFYRNVDLQSCLDRGLTVDGSTIMWWLQQAQEARRQLEDDPQHIAMTLREFRLWVDDGDNTLLWGNGASFDNTIIHNAYRKCDVDSPFKFWNDRCYRTLKNLYPDIKMAKREGTYHNALDDATNQALHLYNLFKQGVNK